MKKIGIMTMQRIVNYGSFLQAFGLKDVLEELGYNVEFVDYQFEKVVSKPENQTVLNKIANNLNVFKFLKKKIILNKFKRKYNNEFLKVLNVDKPNYHPEIDALVIGSDEVFNCLQDYPVGFSRELFGKNYESIDVISYAASFGHTTIEKIGKYGIDKEIKEMLKGLKKISVRDLNSYEIVKNLIGNCPLIHLDPVLITNWEKYLTNNVKLKNYIVVYAYTGRLTKEEEKYITKFAKIKKKKIVSLGMYQRIADINIVPSPFEVLEYFKKADYVITDTFHGTIFSVINHTKFCTIIRQSNKNKLSFLLEELKLSDREVWKISDINKLFKKNIDFSETDLVLKKEREKTRNYLKINLG